MPEYAALDRMSAEVVKLCQQGDLPWLEVENGKLTEACKKAADEVFLKLGGKVFFKSVDPMRARSKTARRGWGAQSLSWCPSLGKRRTWRTCGAASMPCKRLPPRSGRSVASGARASGPEGSNDFRTKSGGWPARGCAAGPVRHEWGGGFPSKG